MRCIILFHFIFLFVLKPVLFGNGAASAVIFLIVFLLYSRFVNAFHYLDFKPIKKALGLSQVGNLYTRFHL